MVRYASSVWASIVLDDNHDQILIVGALPFVMMSVRFDSSVYLQVVATTNVFTKGGLGLIRAFEIRSYMRQILMYFFRARAQG